MRDWEGKLDLLDNALLIDLLPMAPNRGIPLVKPPLLGKPRPFNSAVRRCKIEGTCNALMIRSVHIWLLTILSWERPGMQLFRSTRWDAWNQFGMYSIRVGFYMRVWLRETWGSEHPLNGPCHCWWLDSRLDPSLKFGLSNWMEYLFSRLRTDEIQRESGATTAPLHFLTRWTSGQPVWLLQFGVSLVIDPTVNP